jgi:hypothetical protein
MLKQDVIDKVIEEMKDQIEYGDWTAIDELLHYVPMDALVGFLAEE